VLVSLKEKEEEKKGHGWRQSVAKRRKTKYICTAKRELLTSVEAYKDTHFAQGMAGQR